MATLGLEVSMPYQNVIPAIDRLFRAYAGYLQNTSKDTLFLLLNALHSLDDRLVPEHGRLFFEVPEYRALKALRNLEHHGVEVKYVVVAKDIEGLSMSTDLVFACLISVADQDAAIEGDSKKKQEFRDKDREAFKKTTLQYGDVVDINPCIFNCVVRMFEILRELGLESEAAEYSLLAESYEFEEAQGHSHVVTGRVACHTNDGFEVLKWMNSQYLSAG